MAARKKVLDQWVFGLRSSVFVFDTSHNDLSMLRLLRICMTIIGCILASFSRAGSVILTLLTKVHGFTFSRGRLWAKLQKAIKDMRSSQEKDTTHRVHHQIRMIQPSSQVWKLSFTRGFPRVLGRICMEIVTHS